MFLKHTQNGDLVEIADINTLVDPCQPQVSGRYHAGEEMQDITQFDKSALVFPSGEALPRCWCDAHYRD